MKTRKNIIVPPEVEPTVRRDLLILLFKLRCISCNYPVEEALNLLSDRWMDEKTLHV